MSTWLHSIKEYFWPEAVEMTFIHEIRPLNPYRIRAIKCESQQTQSYESNVDPD